MTPLRTPRSFGEEPPVPTPPPPDPPVDEKRLVDSFLRLVQTPGPSYEERPVADLVKTEALSMGLKVEEDDAGRKIGGNSGNLIVRVPGNVPGAPRLLFAAHMDTVPRAVGVKPVLVDGEIRTDGRTALGGDNRAGCAEILEAVREVVEHDLPHGDLELLFTVGEEEGLLGSQALEAGRISPRYAYAVDAFKPNEIFVQGEHLLGRPGRPFTAEDVRRFDEQGPLAPPVPPEDLNLTPAEQEILAFTTRAMEDAGLKPQYHRIEYAGTDAVALRSKGFNSISLGAGENRPHSRQEKVIVQDLVDATRLIRRLIANAAVPGPVGVAVASNLPG